MNPYQVVKDFEKAVCDYTGAPYAVAVTSCTMALLLAVKWHLRVTDHIDPNGVRVISRRVSEGLHGPERMAVEIPKRTYISVPMSIIHAGGWPVFRDEEWIGMYQLKPLPVWDSARWFTQGLYDGRVDYTDTKFQSHEGEMLCVSFHWTKTLGVGQGGAILHDNPEADEWFRRARFDGRREGVAPKDDVFSMIGWHCYMSPRDAAEGLSRLAILPKHNAPLPNDPYPDLSLVEVFK